MYNYVIEINILIVNAKLFCKQHLINHRSIYK